MKKNEGALEIFKLTLQILPLRSNLKIGRQIKT